MKAWGITDIGLVRKENQDAYLIREATPSGYTICVVCDGMGGPAGGRLASQIAVETFTDEEIECNSRLVVYEGIPLDRNHEFFMIIPENIHVTSLCAAIVKPNTIEAAVIGNLKVEGEKTYFVAEKENIFIDVFLKPINKNNANAEIVLFPKESESYLLKGSLDDYKGALYAIKCRVSFQQLELCKRTLCIDFGTSNTTVGSYNISSGISNSVELVNFLDVSDNVYKCMDL